MRVTSAVALVAIFICVSRSLTAQPRPNTDDPAAIAALCTFGGILRPDGPGGSVIEADLSAAGVTAEDLLLLKRLPSLRTLKLSTVLVNVSNLAFLDGLTNLRVLDLGNARVNDAEIIRLEPLTHLRSLSIDSPDFHGEGLSRLKQLGDLRILRLSGWGLSTRGFKALGELKQLVDLCLDVGGDGDMEELRGLTRLRSLVLSGRINATALASLRALTELRRLGLEYTDLDDRDLKFLPSLPKLEHLEIYKSDISGPGFAHLKGLKQARKS